MNGDNTDSSTELGKLMHDLKCEDPNNMNYNELAESVRPYKEERGKGENMRDVFEEIRLEGAEDQKIEIAM